MNPRYHEYADLRKRLAHKYAVEELRKKGFTEEELEEFERKYESEGIGNYFKKTFVYGLIVLVFFFILIYAAYSFFIRPYVPPPYNYEFTGENTFHRYGDKTLSYKVGWSSQENQTFEGCLKLKSFITQVRTAPNVMDLTIGTGDFASKQTKVWHYEKPGPAILGGGIGVEVSTGKANPGGELYNFHFIPRTEEAYKNALALSENRGVRLVGREVHQCNYEFEKDDETVINGIFSSKSSRIMIVYEVQPTGKECSFYE
jgi:hypothetical protein